MRRERPWKVFVRDIGPTYSFASEEAAHKRARLLVGPEFVLNGVLVGAWADVLVYNYRTAISHTRYRPDRKPVVEHLVEGRWVPQETSRNDLPTGEPGGTVGA